VDQFLASGHETSSNLNTSSTEWQSPANAAINDSHTLRASIDVRPPPGGSALLPAPRATDPSARDGPIWGPLLDHTSCAVVNDLRVCELVAQHHLDHIVVVTCGNVLPLLLGVKWSHTTKSRLIRAPSLYCESTFDRSE
jgi:hypothetical protein